MNITGEALMIHRKFLGQKKLTQIFFLLLCTVVLVLPGFAANGYAGLEWTEKKQLKLEDSPLDVVQSGDGQWIFVLTADSVMVYTAFEDKATQIIPVGTGFDRLSFSDTSKRLVITSNSQKLAKIIELEVVHAIDVSNLPFRGSKNAPVTIAVFSDYQ